MMFLFLFFISIRQSCMSGRNVAPGQLSIIQTWCRLWYELRAPAVKSQQEISSNLWLRAAQKRGLEVIKQYCSVLSWENILSIDMWPSTFHKILFWWENPEPLQQEEFSFTCYYISVFWQWKKTWNKPIVTAVVKPQLSSLAKHL